MAETRCSGVETAGESVPHFSLGNGCIFNLIHKTRGKCRLLFIHSCVKFGTGSRNNRLNFKKSSKLVRIQLLLGFLIGRSLDGIAPLWPISSVLSGRQWRQ